MERFFCNRRQFYLTKILEYVNSDKFILAAAAEILNRENLFKATQSMGISDKSLLSNEDIKRNIKIHYPTNSKKMLYKLSVVYSGLWSLEANRHMDKKIDDTINQIIRLKPELNYIKTVNDTLKKLYVMKI